LGESEFEMKIEAKTVFAFVFISLGIVIILVAVIQVFLGVEHIMELVGIELSDTEGMIEVFGWFFMLLLELLAGYFLASVGVKVYKK